MRVQWRLPTELLVISDTAGAAPNNRSPSHSLGSVESDESPLMVERSLRGIPVNPEQSFEKISKI